MVAWPSMYCVLVFVEGFTNPSLEIYLANNGLCVFKAWLSKPSQPWMLQDCFNWFCLAFPGVWTYQYKICVLHCMTYVYCILFLTLSLKSCLEVCSLRFAIPRPGIAGTVLMFLHVYIYMHIYIYFCLMLVYVHLYTSFHVEGEGGEILNLRFQCDNSLCLL